jgi:nitrogen regulatory protein PII
VLSIQLTPEGESNRIHLELAKQCLFDERRLMMYAENIQALVVVISDPDKLEQVLEVLLECEIRGATIIETQGMAKVLSDHIPIFFGLRGMNLNERERNRTIFALSKHPEKIDKAMEKLSTMFHGFEEAFTGMMFVVPVTKAIGVGRKFRQQASE